MGHLEDGRQMNQIMDDVLNSYTTGDEDDFVNGSTVQLRRRPDKAASNPDG